MAANVLRSTHGKLLLAELKHTKIGHELQLEKILDYIKKDPIAGRLEDPETGNNSYHIVLESSFSENVQMQILEALVASCPEGLKKKNKLGSLPLHICISQYDLKLNIALFLLKSFPDAAKVKDGYGLIPLFILSMRDDAPTTLCKELCKAFKDGPCTLNNSKSYPLHFASKRVKPNTEVLKILIRRFPGAAAQVNDYGVLPLHCVCASTDDLESVKIIYDAYPEAIIAKDRQGRTPLHLAVLSVGRDHSNALMKEMDELKLIQQRLKNSSRSNLSELVTEQNSEDEFEEDLNDEDLNKHISELQERGSKSREFIKFLIEACPQALVTENNFQAFPLDTVLEKTKPSKSTNKIVSVYGLYDDPPTARILMLAQKKYARLNRIPNLRLRYEKILRDLNWLARKDALLVSYFGEPLPGQLAAMMNLKLAINETNGKKNTQNKQKGKNISPKPNPLSPHPSELIEIPNYNILAKLRRRGFEELVRVIIEFI